MRNGQKRMRGRSNNNHRKSQNPLTRVYESNGPDVKIRGTASHIAEKYIQLARDAQSSGDPVAAENYYQHAEHYFRLIAAAQEQFRQQNPYYNNQQPQQQGQRRAARRGRRQLRRRRRRRPALHGPERAELRAAAAALQQPQPQPYLPRDAQPFPPRDQQQPQQPRRSSQQQPYQQPAAGRQQGGGQDLSGLPAFITGGGSRSSRSQNPGARTATSKATAARIASASPAPASSRRRLSRADRPEFPAAIRRRAAPQAGDGGDEPRAAATDRTRHPAI